MLPERLGGCGEAVGPLLGRWLGSARPAPASSPGSSPRSQRRAEICAGSGGAEPRGRAQARPGFVARIPRLAWEDEENPQGSRDKERGSKPEERSVFL